MADRRAFLAGLRRDRRFANPWWWVGLAFLAVATVGMVLDLSGETRLGHLLLWAWVPALFSNMVMGRGREERTESGRRGTVRAGAVAGNGSDVPGVPSGWRNRFRWAVFALLFAVFVLAVATMNSLPSWRVPLFAVLVVLTMLTMVVAPMWDKCDRLTRSRDDGS